MKGRRWRFDPRAPRYDAKEICHDQSAADRLGYAARPAAVRCDQGRGLCPCRRRRPERGARECRGDCGQHRRADLCQHDRGIGIVATAAGPGSGRVLWRGGHRQQPGARGVAARFFAAAQRLRIRGDVQCRAVRADRGSMAATRRSGSEPGTGAGVDADAAQFRPAGRAAGRRRRGPVARCKIAAGRAGHAVYAEPAGG